MVLMIVPMEVRDIDDVMRIEAASFPAPWSRRAFVSELTRNENAYYFVGRIEGETAAYAGMWRGLDTAHITNVAVHPAYRRRGIGTRMLGFLLTLAASMGAVSIELEVRKSNTDAQRLYRRMGFAPKGIRKGYYRDTREDAVVMSRPIEPLPISHE